MARRIQASTTFFFTLMFSAATAAAAQMVGGAIQGTVKDAQGAVLPGAASSCATSGRAPLRADDRSGRPLQVPALPPGEYRSASR